MIKSIGIGVLVLAMLMAAGVEASTPPCPNEDQMSMARANVANAERAVWKAERSEDPNDTYATCEAEWASRRNEKAVLETSIHSHFRRAGDCIEQRDMVEWKHRRHLEEAERWLEYAKGNLKKLEERFEACK